MLISCRARISYYYKMVLGKQVVLTDLKSVDEPYGV